MLMSGVRGHNGAMTTVWQAALSYKQVLQARKKNVWTQVASDLVVPGKQQGAPNKVASERARWCWSHSVKEQHDITLF